MNEKKIKNVFIEGAITPNFIAESIAKHQSKTDIGAHQIFLGQVRADIIDHKEVELIEYSCYKDMALNVFHDIRESCFEKFNISCMHIYHSIGKVKKGEICLFVFVSSKHRKVAFEACSFLVEEIKTKAPIFGKEIFKNKDFKWKVNN